MIRNLKHTYGSPKTFYAFLADTRVLLKENVRTLRKSAIISNSLHASPRRAPPDVGGKRGTSETSLSHPFLRVASRTNEWQDLTATTRFRRVGRRANRTDSRFPAVLPPPSRALRSAPGSAQSACV